jgi:EmrB/QacA subfamily drug resistance transporter
MFCEPKLFEVSINTLVYLDKKLKIKLMIILLVCLFVTSINQSVVAIAGPSIVAALGGFEYYAWIFSAFSLTSAICVPIVGKLNDIIGAKKVILISLIIFTFSTFLCGLSNSMFFFIFSRAVQGIGFAGVMGTIWILIASLWKPRDRGKWLGITSAGFTTSGVIGPIIGGVINDILNWRWIFFLNIPISIIAIIIMIKIFPKQELEGKTKFDYIGAIIFSIFASSFLFAISSLNNSNSSLSLVFFILILISIISIVLFIIYEKNKLEGLVDLSLFKYKYFTGGMLGSLFIVISWTVWSVFLPLTLIGVNGYSASKASLALIALSIGSAIGANFFGNLIGKPKMYLPVSIIGFSVVGISMVISGYTNLEINFNSMLLLAVFVGFGSTGAFSAYTVPIQNNLPEEKLAMITTSLQFSRVFGISLGSSLLGVILLLNMNSYNYEFPRNEIYNPDNIASIEKISEIKNQYLESNKSISLFEEDLKISRNNLKKGLKYVYYSASITAIFGILISIFVFRNTNPHQPEEEDLIHNE